MNPKPFLSLILSLAAAASAEVNFFDPTVPSAVPESLSATGIYSDIVAKTLDPAAKYFEVNSALWSDAAHKDRWIILPPNTQITYVDSTDRFDYPDNTIFVKLFRHDTTHGDTSSRIYWETRLLVKKSGGGTNWYGFSYKWNKAGTQATLVDVNNGLDTVVLLNGAPHYRKWHFPTQDECYKCHRIADEGRAVLGFWPAQLKRPSRANPGIDQVTALFISGVFTGTQPGAAALSRRFRGMGEAIPPGLSDLERFKVIDTMARSYIAANCSGCHGDRGLETGATVHAPWLNYDFYDFKPRMEFGYKTISKDFKLAFPDNELNIGDTLIRPVGRYDFLLTLQQWGIGTGPGTNFDLARANPASYPAGVDPAPYLLVPGYPSYSTILFRQVTRKAPAHDSGEFFRSLDTDPEGRKPWIFKAKWGSKAWRDSLAAHGVGFSQVVSGPNFMTDGTDQMPPIATYIPDTAALKIMSEWIRTYRTLTPVPGESPAVSLRGTRGAIQGVPRIQNRQLIVPEGWTGKAVMISVGGRSVPLSSLGRGRYALPASMPAGVYFFRIGGRTFRTSVMR